MTALIRSRADVLVTVFIIKQHLNEAISNKAISLLF